MIAFLSSGSGVLYKVSVQEYNSDDTFFTPVLLFMHALVQGCEGCTLA